MTIDAKAGETTVQEKPFPPILTAEGALGRGERRGLLAGGLALGLVVLLAAVLTVSLIDRRSQAFLDEIAERQSILLEGRMELALGWLDGLGENARRVADSQLFQLFVTEAAVARGDPDQEATSPANPLAGDTAYLERLLSEFVSTQAFLHAYVVDPEGRLLLRSTDAPPLERLRPDLYESVGALSQAAGPLRESALGLVFDLVLPIAPVQEAAEAPLAALVLTVPAAERLADLQAPQRSAPPEERLRVLQAGEEGIEAVAEGGGGRLLPRPDWRLEGEGLAFAERSSALGEGESYSQARPVPGTSWWLVQERSAEAVSQDLRALTLRIGGAALLVVAALALAGLAAWLGLSRAHKERMALQYRELAGEIERQRALLESINDAVADGIALKDREGRYRYVNPAFAGLVERPAARILGQSDVELFGYDTAQRLAEGDARVLSAGSRGDEEGRPQSVSRERVFIQSRPREWRITKAPYRGAQESGGLVAVVHDVTDLMEAQQRRERTLQQSASALIRAVELRDPYLAGHSRRVAQLAAAVCRELGGRSEEVATLELAGNLSQLGKLWVPRELLTKAERLTPEEIAEVEGHMDHAAKVLSEIDFDLPVRETLMEMHERLDGTGYPKGLKGEEISRLGRILGACDVFCARTAPRAYRGPIPPEKALIILAENATRYDPEVIRALARVVGRRDLA